MPGRFLLDSSILIRIIRGDALLAKRLADLPQVFVVPTIVGELYYGAYKSERLASEEAGIKAVLQAIITLPYDYQTGVEYARIKDALRRKGRPIPVSRYLDCRRCQTVWLNAGASRPAFRRNS